jgi:hypothetical protein
MSGYIGSQPVPQATQTRQTFTATSGQTSFATIGYVAGGQFIQVYLNGVLLKLTDDYTAANGSDIVLTSGAATGDILEFITFADFTVNNQNFTGGLTVDNDGSTVLTVDRATSDGDICRFQKDGSSVGNISSKSGGVFIGNANGDVGIFFNGTADSIDPVNPGNGFNRDNAIDLGTSSARFKDLYLSGGVYLGGTGSANKLSDVEEGDWTPTFGLSTTDPDSVVYNTAVTGGFYRKIGNYVFVSGVLYTSSVTIGSGAGTLLISNLPFVVANSSQGQNGYSSLYIGEATAFSGHHPSSGRFIQSNTAIDLFFRSSSNGGSLTNVGGDLNTGVNKNLLRFSGSYTTQ